jgi:hypothetical protein
MTMSVEEIQVPRLGDEQLEGVVSNAEAQLDELMQNLVVGRMHSRLVEEVGSGRGLDAQSAVGQDAQFIIDSQHRLRSCEQAVNGSIELLLMHRRFLSGAADLSAMRDQISRHGSMRELREHTRHLSDSSSRIAQMLEAHEPFTEDARQMRELLSNAQKQMAVAASAVDGYDAHLTRRPQLESVDRQADLGSFSDRAQSHGDLGL